MSSKTKPRAWATEDPYLGVVGADSLDDMASIIATHPDAYDVRAVVEEHSEDHDAPIDATDVEQVRAFLDTVTVEPVIVPIPVYRRERGGGSRMYPTGLDAKPGRGRVKVLGVHL
ncbi:hypothetical protein [Cellulomonas timonensis]|uniref:hypothetical protein n=1 Tax=Cellulomonas timonensis TaxID=1689271 RepID=UPI00082DFDEA|nr:hypothetical protein [Cellulomonas timonensis]